MNYHRRITGTVPIFSDENRSKRAQKIGFPKSVLTTLMTVTEDN